MASEIIAGFQSRLLVVGELELSPINERVAYNNEMHACKQARRYVALGLLPHAPPLFLRMRGAGVVVSCGKHIVRIRRAEGNEGRSS